MNTRMASGAWGSAAKALLGVSRELGPGPKKAELHADLPSALGFELCQCANVEP